MENSAAVIEINGLEKSYGEGPGRIRAIRGIDLTVNRGEVVAVTGPSGTGKSTLLNLVGCLDNFDRGSIRLVQRDISSLSVDELSGFRNRHIGFIFQLHNLLPEFTALENVMMPLLIRRVKWKTARESAMELLVRFNMEERAGHKPGEMSGGECQRVAVARAIAGEPDLILADEPTGSLDSRNSSILMQMLLDLCREKGSTALIVTHDMTIAGMTDRVISMLDGAIVNT
jgi:lipoprotein-releasing system ATP-binding protein